MCKCTLQKKGKKKEKKKIEYLMFSKWWPFNDFDAILTIQFEKKKKVSSFSTR